MALELSWVKSCIFGMLSGLLDVFPVSAEAHRVLLLKFFGMRAASDVMNLLIHAGVFAALYYKTNNIFSTIVAHSFHNSLALILYLVG